MMDPSLLHLIIVCKTKQKSVDKLEITRYTENHDKKQIVPTGIIYYYTDS